MRTINISLTPQQVSVVDKLTSDLGFASRSEFFRAILRRLFTSPVVKEEVVAWPFAAPVLRSRRKILQAFKKSGQYSPEFLKDLVEGLKNSDYFTS